MSRIQRVLIVIGAAMVLAAGGWYALKLVQEKRAGSYLAEANENVGKANRLMSEIRTADMGSARFSSLENISRGAEAAGAALTLLDEARGETVRAAQHMRRARGLILLPRWYRDYLSMKEQIAMLRTEQIDTLDETVTKLKDLYGSGPVIFTTIEEMDRLLGQFQAELGKLQDAPGEAKNSLDQVARSMRDIQSRLNTAYAENAFELLKTLSQTVGSNAELVELSAQLADATASGDQARAQQAANLVEKKLLESGIGRDDLDLWWRQEITPLERRYRDLQSRQEELDAEAAVLFENRRPG